MLGPKTGKQPASLVQAGGAEAQPGEVTPGTRDQNQDAPRYNRQVLLLAECGPVGEDFEILGG